MSSPNVKYYIVFFKLKASLNRTENIEEDAKYYKEISGLNVKAREKNIEHGNSNLRRCKFLPSSGPGPSMVHIRPILCPSQPASQAGLIQVKKAEALC